MGAWLSPRRGRSLGEWVAGMLAHRLPACAYLGQEWIQTGGDVEGLPPLVRESPLPSAVDAGTLLRHRVSSSPFPPSTRMPTLSIYLVGYLVAASLLGYLALRRGRSWWWWLAISLPATPIVAAIVLWFLPDLVGERQRTREFIIQARQLRRRRDPQDAFSRSRDHQEQQIQAKATTVRLNRQCTAENPPPTRTLRARENRTPITVIMDARAKPTAVQRRARV